jgi:hypothetical protein
MLLITARHDKKMENAQGTVQRMVQMASKNDPDTERWPIYDKSFQFGCISNNRICVEPDSPPSHGARRKRENRKPSEYYTVTNWGLHEEWLLLYEVAMLAHCCLTLKTGGRAIVKFRICKTPESVMLMALFASMFESYELIKVESKSSYLALVCRNFNTNDRTRIRMCYTLLHLQDPEIPGISTLVNELARNKRANEIHSKMILKMQSVSEDSAMAFSLFVYGLRQALYCHYHPTLHGAACEFPVDFYDNEPFLHDTTLQRNAAPYREDHSGTYARVVSNMWRRFIENTRPDTWEMLRRLCSNTKLFGTFMTSALPDDSASGAVHGSRTPFGVDPDERKHH